MCNVFRDSVQNDKKSFNTKEMKDRIIIGNYLKSEKFIMCLNCIIFTYKHSYLFQQQVQDREESNEK